MLHMHELARVLIEDREREIRRRTPRVLGLSSGPRHPRQPDTSAVDRELPALRGRRPRPAYGS